MHTHVELDHLALPLRPLPTPSFYPPLLPTPPCPHPHLHNHLRNPLPTQRLTTHKLILPRRRNPIKRARNQQHHRRRNQARRHDNQAQELHDTHNAIHSRAHVVRRELAHEVVEFAAGGADAQEEGYFDEEDEEGTRSVSSVRWVLE